MTAGRPRIFQSPEAMQERIDEYFDNTEEPTMAGLCNSLDITKQTLHDYQEREEFSDLVKKARSRVEEFVERRLLYNGAGAGAIFWLKNHAGYEDKTKQEHTGANGGPIEWSLQPVAADPSRRKTTADSDDAETA